MKVKGKRGRRGGFGSPQGERAVRWEEVRVFFGWGAVRVGRGGGPGGALKVNEQRLYLLVLHFRCLHFFKRKYCCEPNLMFSKHFPIRF